ncbi:LpxL/LpxP family Kdo(2)-lipid IV(A) lauroyl/palmitoleoyl acyltransferase [Testudinibacter sp. TR-2022]|uniref:LpxL/LpxP family Kdo(2)-lipid IV(A) lauroyl/palmitoleoyl acyltransferase n=1 Tax=Testudinibacter sp. TR-2022 TaxID=2585029 RepID=UPI00111963CC|nr:LpxL/LpxP family Kdo(2)-lipid IV(A) lauroyl/palmitoleoyl acyltransferase [Testudinibacter sp. TR-2022]TNH04882.1 LpxL/LpxP family Kdo(2)-lipid IV(A) lauroyl/palmitoleoyl acyltransferase [Pasteurellaceae bacterium Phil11]TNH21289.1 LpxL/LpxP family Kdo(2)-lipid IV(A) lauroyl/palmitoleoyl acyltransferase [Testudinibacter sp. TR-2022]TNH24362.1 LpxL/LpxP family Kdo(2)-lipid IV(A) lauroyl/palmitoleoyl acyltransferase [Testudinibacter sp. TR-2022]
MAKASQIPHFKAAFLHPKYWPFWIGLAFFRLLLLLPYPILLKIGTGLGWIFSKLSIGKKRAKVARRNLELCFPQKSESEREAILQKNRYSVGMGIIETGMAWFWSDKRIKKWSTASGIQHIKNHLDGGIILVGVHFLTLELGARIIGLHQPGIGVYRPNDNPVFDWIQYKGRIRSNKALLDRKDLRGMIRALREGNMIWYAPDHDYGRKNSVFVPFFAVPDAATTTGSYYLLKSVPNAHVVPFAPLRNNDGSGYHLSVSEPTTFSVLPDQTQLAIQMNRLVEQEILKGVDQYMWLHRRFKTRPNEDDPSRY